MTGTSAVELLVLDFEGVCTFGADELVVTSRTGAGPASIAESIRPDCIEVVQAAQAAGLVVAILSNEISAAWADSVPLLQQVDHIIACSDNGILKPDRRAFQRALILTGCEPHSTLVVDDNDDNVRVAASLGMRTLAFDVGDPASSWRAVTNLAGLSG